ncbi:phosphopantothenoylcysteine decarboxylase isoform 9-T13 [Dama dama]|uniref:phosphopantothenoylcysteine decarboxylase isoform X7 n=1 Tax=Cervus canadensis TaxID=1574408 RepID=UPI001C9E204B|nr:phosphopantothenoylcysteine decarboxylase isoform X7 [Cervus canadensis]XP_043777721.1 phosphopantothenoylcysteine decarboxylase isoform X7 [Cervus elaphus]XP_061014964.1 phosphopantothenoylcysteine decarboxylase isoform X7 [Dama dama]
MEPNSGRLPGLEATRPHMEPRAACSAAAPLRRPFHVLVGVTGSVAALKLPVLVSKLLDIPDTCVIRAWDRSKPLLFCPAMNTAMWEHPITEQQVGQLKAFGYIEIPCVAKKLVCGDQGMGAMAEVGTIVDKVKEVLSQHGGSQQS